MLQSVRYPHFDALFLIWSHQATTMKQILSSHWKNYVLEMASWFFSNSKWELFSNWKWCEPERSLKYSFRSFYKYSNTHFFHLCWLNEVYDGNISFHHIIMGTSSKRSEQWKEILGENIKLWDEGHKMRAHAGEAEGRLLCPSPTSAIASLPISTNRQRIGGKPEKEDLGSLIYIYIPSMWVWAVWQCGDVCLGRRTRGPGEVTILG